jgi:hypothetical protein
MYYTLLKSILLYQRTSWWHRILYQCIHPVTSFFMSRQWLPLFTALNMATMTVLLYLFLYVLYQITKPKNYYYYYYYYLNAVLPEPKGWS